MSDSEIFQAFQAPYFDNYLLIGKVDFYHVPNVSLVMVMAPTFRRMSHTRTEHTRTNMSATVTVVEQYGITFGI